MNGGIFDYQDCRIEDMIDTIESILRNSNKTIKDLYDELSDEEKKKAYHRDWNSFWTTKPGEYLEYIDDEAEKEADKALNIRKLGHWGDGVLFNELSNEEKAKWNQIRQDYINQAIEKHNNQVPGYSLSPEVVEKMKEMLITIKKAKIYLHRIDWLLSGDDGERAFLERTKEDLKKEGLELI